MFLAILGLYYNVQASLVAMSGGYSLVEMLGLLNVGVLSLWSMGFRHMSSALSPCGLQSMGPVVEGHGLWCPTTCGIFLNQGLNLCPLNWQVDSFWTTREVLLVLLTITFGLLFQSLL